jgi:hypothetical protein
MSELFQPLGQEETLQQIQDRLNQGASPGAVIEEMLARSRDEALSWGRRLAGWDEYRRQYPAQAIALARVISLRAMREFGLTLRDDGRVVEKAREGKPRQTPKPAMTFRLMAEGEELRVQYTPGYFPNSGTDLVDVVSPHEPAKPHALSETGYLSRFVPHDVIEACGGPQAYAALLAGAILRGQEKPFTEAFEGAPIEADRRQRRQANRLEAAPVGHAARVILAEYEAEFNKHSSETPTETVRPAPTEKTRTAKPEPANPDEADQTGEPVVEKVVRAKDGRTAAWLALAQALYSSAEFRYVK